MSDLHLEFQDELNAGKTLCVMPVPRLRIEEIIRAPSGLIFIPPDSLDLPELHVVSFPAYEWSEIQRTGQGDLGWAKSAATQITLEEFVASTLVAMTTEAVDWDMFLQGDHGYHLGCIRACAEKAEGVMDLVRFAYCRLDVPQTLPGRVGLVGGGPFSAALLYRQADHESYVVAGETSLHTVVGGLGLELMAPLRLPEIADGETGNFARRALSLLTSAFESNSVSLQFIQCLSLLEFLASPDEWESYKYVKKSIAAHVAKDANEYQSILDDFKYLTSKKDINGQEIGLRTRVVHGGARLEDIVVDSGERTLLMRRLQRYIGRTINDMIERSALTWADFLEFRKQRQRAFA